MVGRGRGRVGFRPYGRRPLLVTEEGGGDVLVTDADVGNNGGGPLLALLLLVFVFQFNIGAAIRARRLDDGRWCRLRFVLLGFVERHALEPGRRVVLLLLVARERREVGTGGRLEHELECLGAGLVTRIPIGDCGWATSTRKRSRLVGRRQLLGQGGSRGRVMPSAVGDGRGCQLAGHGGEALQLGGDFAGIVVAAAQDGNVVQGQARLDAGLEELGAGAEVVDGLPLEMESLPQHPDVGLDVQAEDVVPTLPAQRLLELRPIEPAPVEPAHIADGAKAVAVIDRYELEVVRILRPPTAQEVGRVAIGVEDADVQDGDLVHLVDTELGGAEIVHGVIGVDKVLKAPDLLPQDGGVVAGRNVDSTAVGGGGRREGEGVRPDGRPALAELEPRPVGVEGRMPRLGEGGGGNSREAPVVEQVRGHLPDARLAGADAGPHPVVEAAVEAEAGSGVDLGGGGDVAAGVVGGVRLLVGRLEDGDLGLVGVVEEVRATGPVEDEVGLEADGKPSPGLADRPAQPPGGHVQEA